MIKQHTAQSLGKYLGGKVSSTTNGVKYHGTLIKLNSKSEMVTIELIQEAQNDWIKDQVIKISVPVRCTYPILKTYEKLIEPMMYEGKEILPIEYIYGKYFREEYFGSIGQFSEYKIKNNWIFGDSPDITADYLISRDFEFSYFMDTERAFGGYMPIELEKLLELNFGAIENPESPTGFVDLFGYHCVLEEK